MPLRRLKNKDDVDKSLSCACRPHKRYFYHNHAVFCNSTSLNDFTKGHKTTKATRRTGSARSTKKQRMISCFTVSSVRRCNSSKLMNREGDIAADGSPGWRWCKPGRSLSSPGRGLRSSVLVWSCEADVGGPKDKKQYKAAIYYIFVWGFSIIDKSIKKIHSGRCPILFFLHIVSQECSKLMMTHAIVNVSPNVYTSYKYVLI